MTEKASIATPVPVIVDEIASWMATNMPFGSIYSGTFSESLMEFLFKVSIVSLLLNNALSWIVTKTSSWSSLDGDIFAGSAKVN